MAFVLAVIQGQDYAHLCGMPLSRLMYWHSLAAEIEKARAGNDR